MSNDPKPLDTQKTEAAEGPQRGRNPPKADRSEVRPEPGPGELTVGDVTRTFSARAAVEAMQLKQLGDFRIVREVGRGGMGIVYEAMQESLGRRVALKVLPATARLDRRQQQRFEREARSAARLHHTNIVPVFGIGAHDGLHYYVMQFIDGLSLDRVLAELRGHPAAKPLDATTATAPRDDVSAAPAADLARTLPTGAVPAPAQAADRTEALAEVAGADEQLPEPAAPGPLSASSVLLPGQIRSGPSSDTGRSYWHSVARVGIHVAEALAYAHGQGIVHRDIKPSNLLLDAQATVWVTDFGLAKAVEGDNLTQSGDLLGTLRYMAPERFHGHCDARSDIFGLGLTLYELLVRRPAFEERDRNKLIHHITHGEPIAPRKVHAAIPRDLETIVLKAIEREPARRYQTAAALTDDLKRFLEDRPIRARRVKLHERLVRWSRRNPAIAGLAALVATLLVAAAVASALAAEHFRVLAAREGQARQDADLARKQAEENAETIKQTAARLNVVDEKLESGRLFADHGQWAKAFAEANAALALQPDYARVWIERSNLYSRLDLPDEAADDLKRAFELQPPADPFLWLRQGSLCVLAGDNAGYRQVCKQMVERFATSDDPLTAMLVVRTCTLSPAGPDPQQMVQLAERTLQKTKQVQGPYQHALAAALFRAGQHEQALRHFPAGYGWAGFFLNHPFQAMTHHRLGRNNEAEAAIKTADDWLGQITKTAPKGAMGPPPGVQPTDWFAFQILRREALTLITGKADDPPQLWARRASARAALGAWDKAADHWSKALTLKPAEVDYLFERGRAWGELNQWDRADHDLTEAVKEAKADPKLLLECARFYADKQRWEKAEALYQQVRLHDPNQVPLLLERGRMFARRGLVDQAAADFDQALSAGVKELDATCNELIAFEPVVARVAVLRHEDLRWQRAVCRAFLRAGKPAQAIAFLDTLPPAQAGKWELVLERGNIHAHCSQWQEAADAFARAFEMREPDNPHLWFAHGILRLQVGDHAGYRRVSRTCLEYFGSTEEATTATLVAALALLSAQELPELAPIEQLAKSTKLKSRYPWGNLAAGLAHYRAGAFEEALKVMPNVFPDNLPGAGAASCCLLQAMCRQRLGKGDEAQPLLNDANRLLDRQLAKNHGMVGADWTEWLVAQALLREARGVLGK